MKRLGSSLFSTTAVLFASLALPSHTCAGEERAPTMQVQGRPLSDWVAEVDVSEIYSNHNSALDVLLSAGPRIMTNLADLLLYAPSTHELAGAALTIGAIAYYNPGAPQSQVAVPSLASSAGGYDPRVRVLAIQGLGAVGKAASNAIPLLLRLTKDEDRSLRMCAVESLGRIGIATPQTVDALRSSMSDTDGEVSVESVQALYKLGQPPNNAISVLVRLTKDEDVGARCVAVETLGQVGTNSPEAVAALKSALSDTGVRPLASKALKSLKAD